MKSRIALMSLRRKDKENPSKPIPETSIFGPMRSQGTEESWHDAKEGCKMACEKVDEETRERPDRGAYHAALQAVWDTIRPWLVGPRPESA